MIASQAGEMPVKLMCRTAEASRSGYYAWKKRPESPRASENRRLLVEIRTAFDENFEAYGSRRIHAELVSNGHVCDRHRVERLMRLYGIRAVQRNSPRHCPDDRPHEESVVPDLLHRNFVVALPDRVWLVDITQFRTREGVLYVALVLDLCSRMNVADGRCVSDGSRLASTAADAGQSLRPWRPVRLPGLRPCAQGSRRDSEHEPAGQSV